MMSEPTFNDLEDCLNDLDYNGSENIYEVLIFLLHYINDKEKDNV